MTVPAELPLLAEYVTISKAAAMMGMSRQTVHQMTKGKNPRLPAWRIESDGDQDPVVVKKADARRLARKSSTVVDPTQGM